VKWHWKSDLSLFLVAPPQARWIQEQASLLPPAAHAINQTGGDRVKPHAPPPPPLLRDASPAAAAAASEGAWGLGKPHGPPPPPLPRDASPAAAAATGCFRRAPLCLPLAPAASPVPKVRLSSPFHPLCGASCHSSEPVRDDGRSGASRGYGAKHMWQFSGV
jgi:hypothetical protein